MGLEAATYINDLDISNPLAGDKKNQGDDHLRLIKSVLKTSIPNSDRPFRIPEFLAKSGSYNVLTTDDNKTIYCDTSAGSISLNLPTPTFDGWSVRVVKATTDVNPVFVLVGVGTINGVFTLIRCNIPFLEERFVWTGTVFIRPQSGGSLAAGSIEFSGAPLVPVGYGLANGQSLVRGLYPELFNAWGTTYGAADGTHFSAPDYRDRFLVGAGSTYAVAAFGGEATHVLSTAEIPAHTHANALTDPGHTTPIKYSVRIDLMNGGAQAAAVAINPGQPVSGNSDPATTGITINNVSAGGGGAHENRPPYMASNPIFRLC